MIQSRTFYVICQANKYIILEPVLRPIAAGWTKDTNKQENIYILGSVPWSYIFFKIRSIALAIIPQEWSLVFQNKNLGFPQLYLQRYSGCT